MAQVQDCGFYLVVMVTGSKACLGQEHLPIVSGSNKNSDTVIKCLVKIPTPVHNLSIFRE